MWRHWWSFWLLLTLNSRFCFSSLRAFSHGRSAQKAMRRRTGTSVRTRTIVIRFCAVPSYTGGADGGAIGGGGGGAHGGGDGGGGAGGGLGGGDGGGEGGGGDGGGEGGGGEGGGGDGETEGGGGDGSGGDGGGGEGGEEGGQAITTMAGRRRICAAWPSEF